MRTLGERGSFGAAAAVAGLALWSSAAPTMVYPLYLHEWGLNPAVTTAIFAAYPMVLIPVLLVFGNLSDVIGRRASILIGLAALLAGTVAFGLATDLGWVFAGRALQGLGVGLALSPATAAMIEFGGAARAALASSTTTAATAGGLALATLVGGWLVQYAPAKMHLTFWVLAAVTTAVLCVAWYLPRTLGPAGGHWRPRTVRIPAGVRIPFTAGTLGISTAYALGAVYLALGAQIARDLVGSTNALVSGAIISVSAVVIGVVAVAARRLAPRIAVTVGPVLVLVALLLLDYAGVLQSLPLFLGSSVIGGAGYSLMFAGGLGLITAAAPAQHRGAMISLAYVIGYAVQAAAALVLGAIATTAGLQTAIEVATPTLTLIGLAALVTVRLRRPSPTPVVAEVPLPIR